MQYLFSTLSKIVNQFIYEGGKATRPPGWQNDLAVEKQNLMAEFKRLKHLPGLNREVMPAYIEKHYIALLDIINEVTECMDTDRAIYLSELEDIRFFIELHFYEYSLKPKRDILHLRCTVEELALICRMFIGTGLIAVKSKKELSKFIRKHFAVISSEDQPFSEDHFYNSMFSYKLHTVKTLELMLEKQKEVLSELKQKL